MRVVYRRQEEESVVNIGKSKEKNEVTRKWLNRTDDLLLPTNHYINKQDTSI